jgi:S-adenosylmethionine/arginine decarboxylase-like enzyme
MKGRHVKIVGRARLEVLANKETIESFLSDVLHAIGSKPATPPFVQVDVHGCIAGFVLLPTSHAVIHAWPKDRRLMFDLFCPFSFHDITVLSAVVRHFGLSRYHLADLSRPLALAP